MVGIQTLAPAEAFALAPAMARIQTPAPTEAFSLALVLRRLSNISSGSISALAWALSFQIHLCLPPTV